MSRATKFGPQPFELIVEMAHDFRSPLSCILMLTESLLQARSGPLNPVQERQLRLIFGAALGLSVTTSNAMELAREEGGLADADPERMDVGALLRGVRDTLDPMAREQQLGLLLELPSDDRDRLGLPRAITSVLVTLALRALRKMSSGSVEIGAQISEDDSNLIAFWVRDSGPSITMSELPALFEPFTPEGEDKPREISELGSGLFISSQLVAEMGGELLVRPNPDGGSLFSFTLSLPLLPRRSG